jgi:coproporphyrinogen III oxidase-like Fe-S oxidoreductase
MTNQRLLEKVNRGGYEKERLLGALKACKRVNVNVDVMIGMNEDVGDRRKVLSLIGEVLPRQVTVYVLELNEGSYFHRQGYSYGK